MRAREESVGVWECVGLVLLGVVAGCGGGVDVFFLRGGWPTPYGGISFTTTPDHHSLPNNNANNKHIENNNKLKNRYVTDYADLISALKRYRVAMVGSGAWACAALKIVAQNCAADDAADLFEDEVGVLVCLFVCVVFRVVAWFMIV